MDNVLELLKRLIKFDLKMLGTKLVRLTAQVVGESRRTLAAKVDRLRSANFLDVKQSLALANELKERPFRLRGWINSTVKSKKNVCFFHLNDGLSNDVIQVVLSKELENSLKHNLVYGTSVICTGQLVESIGRSQSIEFKASQVEFAGRTELFPFHNKEHSDDWDNIRHYMHLRFKSRHFASLQRIRGKLLVRAHEYLQSNGYLNITTPIITMNDCEGGGEAFQVLSPDVSTGVSSDVQPDQSSLNSKDNQNSSDNQPNSQSNSEPTTSSNASVDTGQESTPNESSNCPAAPKTSETFFGKPTFLTVSGQLHLEAAALGVNRVYTLSPCFRSEDSISRKHLCEFLMLELEETYLDSLNVLMNRAERLCKDLLAYLISECKDEIDLVLSKINKSYLDAIINHDYKR